MDATIIDINKGRTSGDGMEEPAVEQKTPLTAASTEKTEFTPTTTTTTREGLRKKSGTVTNQAPLPGLHTLYRRTDSVRRSLAPVLPAGELIRLVPRLVTTTTTTAAGAATNQLNKTTKPPRFIPYEPYPGAVNPILPTTATTTSTNRHRKLSNTSTSSNTTTKTQIVDNRIKNKNNLDIAELAEQMSTIRTQELDVEPPAAAARGAETEELQKLRAELAKVKEERDYFKTQFKFQTQVNAELKNLLVASVGEDLQTRVNVLTEDKLQLARALLDTAQNLSTHTEQIEFLAGQCEVWRSKFLASSVMIEELARWKADLTQKNQMLNDAVKHLLHALQQLRGFQLELLKHLKFLAKIRYLNLPATDVMSLSAENMNIAQQMVLHTGVGIPDTNATISTASTSPLCDAERFAIQALEFISQPLMATDEAIRALFQQTKRSYVQPNLPQVQEREEQQQEATTATQLSAINTRTNQ